MPHGSQEGRGVWAGLLPAATLLLSSTLGLLIIGSAPQAGQTQLAVVAAPWKSLVQTAEMIGAADGVIVEAGGLPNVIIAHSDDPGFVDALYRAGAWLVIDPILLRGCLGFDTGRNPIRQKAKSDV
jgi:hypothetical protein